MVGGGFASVEPELVFTGGAAGLVWAAGALELPLEGLGLGLAAPFRNGEPLGEGDGCGGTA